ncbi:MAG: hypothetical protein JWM98_1953 [Thermoleophilia bacterium]|nr:hypothetical protein [Thermoleophilia bacterium]
MFRRRHPDEAAATDADPWFWRLDGPAIARTRFGMVKDGFDPDEVGVFLNETGRLVDELLIELDRLYETYEPGDDAAEGRAA